MKTRTHKIHVALGTLLAGFAAFLGAACGGGGGDGGPIIVPMNDASGNQTGSGGSGGSGGVGGSGATGGAGGAGGSTDTGGSGGGDADAADEGAVSTPEASTNEAGTCITSPVTFEDYLNACPDSRVLGCLTFTTPLPNPLPPLP